MAIKSFKSKALERFFIHGVTKGLNPKHIDRIALRLAALAASTKPEDMNRPGWRFHSLSGDMKGHYAVNVSGNWRITFACDADGPAAVDVDYLDYH